MARSSLKPDRPARHAKDPDEPPSNAFMIPQPRRAGNLALFHPAAVLMGLAAGWQFAGMHKIIASAIDPLPTTSTMFAVVVLLSSAVGPWLPERFVLAIAHFLSWRSRQSQDSTPDEMGTFWMLRAIRQRDQSLQWLSLALIASLAGLVSLITLALSGPAGRLYAFLLDRFYWTNLTLSAVEWFGLAALMGASWVAIGLVAAALAPVSGSPGISRRYAPGVAAGLLIGLGLAWILQKHWADARLSGNQVVMLGVLPMFALAALAARRSQAADQQRKTNIDDETQAPELSTAAQGWIWLSLVVWGASAAIVGTGWTKCQYLATAKPILSEQLFGWLILIMGLGVAAAALFTRLRSRSASGCGMAMWAAGLGAGATATIGAMWPSSPAVAYLQIMTLALSLGYALHYVERAWLARAGSETLGFAQLVSALLVGSAVGLVAAQYWTLPQLGPMGTITAGALMMLAWGGLTQIYEVNRPARTQYQRLALIFASLAVAMLLFPMNTKKYSRWQNARYDASTTAIDAALLNSDPFANARKICLIGLDPAPIASWLNNHNGRIDVFARARRNNSTRSAITLNDRTTIHKKNSCRTMRLDRSRYDLIYQRPAAELTPDFWEYSAEWLGRLAEHSLDGGTIIIEVPLAGLNIRAIKIIAATFDRVMGESSAWRLTEPTGQRIALLLKAVPTSQSPTTPDKDSAWQPIAQLIDSDPFAPRAHTIRRNRISRAIEDGQEKPLDSLINWLINRASPTRNPASR